MKSHVCEDLLDSDLVSTHQQFMFFFLEFVILQVHHMRLVKKIKDDSISEPSWVGLVGYYGYHTYMHQLLTLTLLYSPTFFSSPLHYHNITPSRPTPSLLPTNIMTFAYRCLTCSDNAFGISACQSVYRLKVQSADVWTQVRPWRQSKNVQPSEKILIMVIIAAIIASATSLAWKNNDVMWALTSETLGEEERMEWWCEMRKNS